MKQVRPARIAALIMLLSAIVIVAGGTKASATCSCQANQECSYDTGCYSAYACIPDGTHRSCNVWDDSGGTYHCQWSADLACP